MHALALACGNVDHLTAAPWFRERIAGAGLPAPWQVPATPGKQDLAPVLDALAGSPQEAGTRLVVLGMDADLAAVALRLLRGGRLPGVSVGFVPAAPSEVASNWGMPTEPRTALHAALVGQPSPVPLLRDDAGGVLVGIGTIGNVRGVAYCDNAEVLRGRAARVEVRPTPAGLGVRVLRPGLLGRRETTAEGRAFEIGCAPVAPASDGVTHPRSLERWTWYRHTEDLRLIRS